MQEPPSRVGLNPISWAASRRAVLPHSAFWALSKPSTWGLDQHCSSLLNGFCMLIIPALAAWKKELRWWRQVRNPPGKLGYNPWPLTAEEASGHYNLMLILCKASFSPSSSVTEKWFVSLCSTLHCDALSGLFHASANLRLVPAPHGLFSHQTCGSTVLRGAGSSDLKTSKKRAALH